MAKQKNSSYLAFWIKFIIVFAFMVFFGNIPAPEPITPLGMKVVGIFIGAVIGWSSMDVIVTSCMALLALALHGYGSIASVFGAAFGGAALLQLCAVMIFCGTFSATGVGKWIGRWMVSRKVFEGRPWLLTFSLLAAAYILGPLCHIAVIIMLWDIIEVVKEETGMTKEDKWPQIMVFILMLIFVTGIYYTFHTSIISNLGIAANYDPTITIEAYPFIIYGLIVSLALALLCFGLLVLIFKPKVDKLRVAKIAPPGPMNKREKYSFYVMIAFIIAVILPSVLPKSWAFTKLINTLGLTGISVVFLILVLVMRADGEQLVTFKECVDKGLVWAAVFMPAAAFTLAGALTSADAGVSAWLSQTLTPLFGNMNPTFFGVALVVTAMILTNFINNIVVGSLFLPIIYTVAPIVGANPYPIFLGLVFAISFAILLPSANPMAAFLYGNKNRISSTEIMSFALVSMVGAAIVLSLVALPLGNIMYPM